MKSVDALTAALWLKNGEAFLLDVREPEEYKHEHIDGAMLMPLDSVNAAKLPSLATKKLIVQCHAGVRSAHACNRLLTENPALDAYNLTGGIAAWADAGLPVIR